MHFSNIQIKKKTKPKKKKKKKHRTTKPPNFQAKRANKPLFLLSLILQRCYNKISLHIPYWKAYSNEYAHLEPPLKAYHSL